MTNTATATKATALALVIETVAIPDMIERMRESTDYSIARFNATVTYLANVAVAVGPCGDMVTVHAPIGHRVRREDILSALVDNAASALAGSPADLKGDGFVSAQRHYVRVYLTP